MVQRKISVDNKKKKKRKSRKKKKSNSQIHWCAMEKRDTETRAMGKKIKKPQAKYSHFVCTQTTPFHTRIHDDEASMYVEWTNKTNQRRMNDTKEVYIFWDTFRAHIHTDQNGKTLCFLHKEIASNMCYIEIAKKKPMLSFTCISIRKIKTEQRVRKRFPTKAITIYEITKKIIIIFIVQWELVPRPIALHHVWFWFFDYNHLTWCCFYFEQQQKIYIPILF